MQIYNRKITVAVALKWSADLSVNVWKLRVIPVPVSSGKDPVWGDGVGVISLVKPPGQWRYLL